MLAKTEYESNMEIQIEHGYRQFKRGFSYGLHEEQLNLDVWRREYLRVNKSWRAQYML